MHTAQVPLALWAPGPLRQGESHILLSQSPQFKLLVCPPLDCEYLHERACLIHLCHLTESLALCPALGKYLLNEQTESTSHSLCQVSLYYPWEHPASAWPPPTMGQAPNRGGSILHVSVSALHFIPQQSAEEQERKKWLALFNQTVFTRRAGTPLCLKLDP